VSERPDLDLRLVRYFVAVARYEHFGRAADHLRVAQPSLSRQIRRLEQQLGTRLLDRTPRGTHLTPAGTVFLPRARDLLRLAEQATGQARAAAEPARLIAGYTSNLIITPVAARMRRLHPDARIEVRHLPWDRAAEHLLDHTVDVAITRMPLSEPGLRVHLLYEEPRAVLLGTTHRLAGRTSLTLAEIADEPVPRTAVEHRWAGFWTIEPRPDGSRAPDGPVIRSAEEKLEVVAAGQAVAFMPLAESYHRPDVVGVPLLDAPPVPVVLATREREDSRLVSAFVEWAGRILRPPAPGSPTAGA